MKITTTQYAKALYGSLENKTSQEVDGLVANFLKLLRKNNQMNLAKKITESFSSIYDVENGIVSAEVTSAQTLDEASLEKVRQFVTGKYAAREVVLKNVVDAKMKSGIILKVGQEMLDISLAKKMENLRRQLVK